MKFHKILIILSIILMKRSVLVRNQIRTKPLEVYCEDVCTDGRNCLTDEWVLCKWKQLMNPSIICCLKRKPGAQNHETVGQSSAVSLQKYCPNSRRHYLVRRDIFSFLRGLAYGSAPMATVFYPWVVEVLAFGRHLCGGSVISDYVVLTAAHCFVPFFDSSVYSLRIGFNASIEGRVLSVSQIIRHELYFPSESYHDIALIVTQTAIHTKARVDIVCLPSPEMRIAQMVGWGATVVGFDNDFYTKVVSKQLEVRIVSREECAQMYAIGDKHNIPVGIQRCMICAGALGHQDVTLGDSGGPLIVIINGVQYIIGMVSFGRKSGTSIPGVYTNVLYYRNWIFNKLSNIQ